MFTMFQYGGQMIYSSTTRPILQLFTRTDCLEGWAQVTCLYSLPSCTTSELSPEREKESATTVRLVGQNSI